MKTPLTDREQEHLDHLEHKWEMQLYELKKFKKKFGHCNVPGTKGNNPYMRLATWCVVQRRLRKFEPLKYSPVRKQKLNDIGFSWSVRETWFEITFRMLKKYHEKYGHCEVGVGKHPVLAIWCSRVRNGRRTHSPTLTKERIRRLDALGFPWHDLMKAKWEKHFTLLKDYHTKHGHPNVNKKENIELFNWCRVLRNERNMKKVSMTKERIARLDALSFNWENQITNKWELHFAELLEYKKKRGDYNVPNTHNSKSPLYSLGQWVGMQRRYYRTNSKYLTPNRATKLNGIGFNWQHPDIKRKSTTNTALLLNELKRLNKVYGTLPSQELIKKHGKYPADTYRLCFGGIPQARKAAGLRKLIPRRRVSNEQLLEELKRLAIVLGRTPLYSDVVQQGKYSEKLYYERFDSFTKARKKAMFMK